MKYSTILLLVLGPWGFAQELQRFGFGGMIGVQGTESFNSAPGFNADSSRFVFGPTITYSFNDYFGAEGNILYRHQRFDALTRGVTLPTAISTSEGHILDFPLLAKWRPFGIRPVEPFAIGGVTFRYLNSNETIKFFAGDDRDQKLERSFAQDSAFNAGITVGGGVAFLRDTVRIVPQIRYTGWARENFKAASPVVPGGRLFTSQQNQFDVLLGFVF